MSINPKKIKDMIIRKTQHLRRSHAKSWRNPIRTAFKHQEVHKITTYWFLFIPVCTTHTLVSTNLI